MYRVIIVPLDGSRFGEQALMLACDIARRSGAEIQLVHVYQPVASDTPTLSELLAVDEAPDAPGLGEARAYLTCACERVATMYEVTATTTLLAAGLGDARSVTVAQTLADYIAASGADLVVMTTHGRGVLSRLWLGSVADTLVRRSPAPIVLLRPAADISETNLQPSAWRFLIPLDGSALAEAIIAPTVALGTILHAEYTLLHVVNPSALVNYAPIAEQAGDNPNVVDERYAVARNYLEQVAGRMAAEGLTVRTRVSVSPHTASAILDGAYALGHTLIAIATHGRCGRERLLLGSVADKVVRGADLPVLLYCPQSTLSAR